MHMLNIMFFNNNYKENQDLNRDWTIYFCEP